MLVSIYCRLRKFKVARRTYQYHKNGFELKLNYINSIVLYVRFYWLSILIQNKNSDNFGDFEILVCKIDFDDFL